MNFPQYLFEYINPSKITQGIRRTRPDIVSLVETALINAMASSRKYD